MGKQAAFSRPRKCTGLFSPTTERRQLNSISHLIVCIEGVSDYFIWAAKIYKVT